MKISLNWLRNYIKIDLLPEKIGEILTMAGLEVDAIENISLKCEDIIVAKVLKTHKHPQADTLTVATVSDGKEVHQVVCGAPNCREGIKVAFAPLGATLFDENQKPFKIKKCKLRGVESFGMLCSGKELGISNEDEGILELNESYKEGSDLNRLYEDVIFEISLTPNLGHCSSLIGVARELSAALEIPYSEPEIKLVENLSASVSDFIRVKIENKESCPRYACRVIREVTVSPSPDWLKKYLETAGLRSVNNVVDITNFVMLEFGHPLHAFDGDKLDGNEIIVKNAAKGEKFVTLDGKERILQNDDLLICDAVKPVALAGIMGGKDSEVTEITKNIVLEAAFFSPKCIRKSSKVLNLMTDASKRFERGTDPNILIKVLDRAAELIQICAGGNIASGWIDHATKIFPKQLIDCRVSRINKVLGTHLVVGEIEHLFTRLEFIFKWDGDNTFTVEVPTYRNDINEEIDLIEEIARVYGYNYLTKSYTQFESSKISHDPLFVFERSVRTRLISEGLQEFLTCDLIGPKLLEIVHGENWQDPSMVKVLNPTSVEQSILRTSLLPGLLQVIKYNWDHQNPNIAGFEIGRIHYREENTYREQSLAAILLSGKSRMHHWDDKPKDFDFFDLKGIIENCLIELKVQGIFTSSSLITLHPGRQSKILIENCEIGSFGEIHPAVLRRLDINQPILFAEINLNDLLKILPEKSTQMKPIPIYPGSERDWTITLGDAVDIGDIFKAIYASAPILLEDVSVQDLYRSDKIGKEQKNLTLRFFYRDKSKTIEQEKVDKEHARLLENVSKSMNDFI